MKKKHENIEINQFITSSTGLRQHNQTYATISSQPLSDVDASVAFVALSTIFVAQSNYLLCPEMLNPNLGLVRLVLIKCVFSYYVGLVFVGKKLVWFSLELALRNFESILCCSVRLKGALSIRVSLGGNFSFPDFNRDFDLVWMVLFYCSTFVVSLFMFEAQKPKFWPKRVIQSFHTKSGPEFWNPKTMSNLYFLETRIFNDHFCLLHRFHPGPVKWCFNGHKIWA